MGGATGTRSRSDGDARLWFVYVVQCGDGSLYTGIATDVERRLEEHRAGPPRGARYLRGRRPLRVVFARQVGPRALALRVEHRLKRLSRERKRRLLSDTRAFERLVRELRDRP